MFTSTHESECVLVAQVRMVELCHLCAPKKSIFRSAMSHPCWSFSHLLTSSPSQHAALSGPRDVLQDNTVHRQPLLQEPLQPLPEQLLHEPLPANAIRSENNATESLSDTECESARNLRMNTRVDLACGETQEELVD